MKRTLLVVGLLLMVALAALATQTASEAVKIRKLPQRAAFLAAVDNAEPRGALLRYLLLRPGERIYHAAILPWLYAEPAVLEDNPWNRLLLERHVLALPRDLALEYIDRYPLTASSALQALLVEALREGNLAALRKLAQFEEGREVLDGWLAESVIEPGDFDLFARSFPVLVQVPRMDPGPLLDRFVDRLNEDSPSYDLFADRKALSEAIQGSPNAVRLLDWVASAVEGGKLSVGRAEGLLSALLVTPEVSEATARLIMARERVFPQNEIARFILPEDCFDPEHDDCEVSSAIPTDLLEYAFTGLEGDSSSFLALFHALAHSGGNPLKEASERILRGPDSEIRKGAIVLLARHENSAASFDIDQAFAGSYPRPLLFSDQLQYMDSQALESYETLAGHKYDRIGKRFPPYMGGKLPERGHIDDWRRFIESYPWFPATDDAYYRLAHLQFLYGDLEGSGGTIREYRERSFVDQDIEPYMAKLEIAIELARLGVSADFAGSIIDFEDLPWLYYAPIDVRGLEAWALRIDWLLMANPDDEQSRARLAALRRDLDHARAECTRTWFEDCGIPESTRHFASDLSTRAPGSPEDDGG